MTPDGRGPDATTYARPARPSRRTRSSRIEQHMRLSTFLRPAVLCSALLAPVLAAGCSSGGGDHSSTGSTGGGSEQQYCAAIRALNEQLQPYSGSVIPTDQESQIVDQLTQALAVAPPKVAEDFRKSVIGDSYARDNFDLYNKRQCGVDTSSLKAPSP